MFGSLVDYGLDAKAAGRRHLIAVLALALRVSRNLCRPHLLFMQLVLIPAVLGFVVLLFYRFPGSMYEFQTDLRWHRMPFIVRRADPYLSRIALVINISIRICIRHYAS